MNERIKELRRALKLTQAEFASKIGSVQNTITGYETGRREPSNQVITLICKTFNVSEVWLKTGEGEMVSVLARLSEEEWGLIADIAQKLVESNAGPPEMSQEEAWNMEFESMRESFLEEKRRAARSSHSSSGSSNTA